MEIPSWLDEKFLASTLKRSSRGEITNIASFTVKSAVPPGNNYLSHTFRVEVKYQLKGYGLRSISLIIKAPIQGEFGKEMSEKMDFYGKEPKVYEDLLEAMNKIVSEEFSPKYYPCPVKDAVVLQDLKEEGYVMCDRFKQLDFVHCKEVLIAVAKFHAASVAYHHENPTLIETLGKEMFFVKEGPLKNGVKLGFENSYRNAAEAAKELNVSKQFIDLVSNRNEELWEGIVNIPTPRPSKLNVLNHGDVWTTNILFKHDEEGNVERVKFVDYQLTRFASPAFDLAFFVWTSGNEEIREKSQEDLYSIYLQTLNDTLKKLGCRERYSSEDLYTDLKEASDFVLNLICHFLPIFMADPEEGVLELGDFNTVDEESMKNNKRLQKLHRGKYYKKLLPTLARQYLSFFCP